jgi:hypothetical protein
VFRDDFTSASIDASWQQVKVVGNGSTRTQANGTLQGGVGGWVDQSYLLQPAITSSGEVKLEYISTATSDVTPFVAGYTDNSSPRYVGYYYALAKQFVVSIRDASNTTPYPLQSLLAIPLTSAIPSSTIPLKVEF